MRQIDYDEIENIIRINSSSGFLKHVKVIDSVDDLNINFTRKGLIFIYVNWSSNSSSSLKRLVQVLNSFEISQDFILEIIDGDSIASDYYDKVFKFTPGGWGEIILVKDCEIHSVIKGIEYNDPFKKSNLIHEFILS